MRIDLNHAAQPLPESSRTNQGPQPRASANSAAGSVLGQDQAQLSGAHVQIQALAAQASQLPEVRQERVQALRQVVQSGNYHPRPEDVAEAMMAHMKVEPAA
jgi:flagellar biosynthesis anti-sigma factor FlgM